MTTLEIIAHISDQGNGHLLQIRQRLLQPSNLVQRHASQFWNVPADVRNDRVSDSKPGCFAKAML